MRWWDMPNAISIPFLRSRGQKLGVIASIRPTRRLRRWSSLSPNESTLQAFRNSGLPLREVTSSPQPVLQHSGSTASLKYCAKIREHIAQGETRDAETIIKRINFALAGLPTFVTTQNKSSNPARLPTIALVHEYIRKTKKPYRAAFHVHALLAAGTPVRPRTVAALMRNLLAKVPYTVDLLDVDRVEPEINHDILTIAPSGGKNLTAALSIYLAVRPLPADIIAELVEKLIRRHAYHTAALVFEASIKDPQQRQLLSSPLSGHGDKLSVGEYMLQTIVTGIWRALFSIPRASDTRQATALPAFQALGTLSSLLYHRQLPYSEISALLELMFLFESFPGKSPNIWVSGFPRPESVDSREYVETALQSLIDDLPSSPSSSSPSPSGNSALLPPLSWQSLATLYRSVRREWDNPAAETKVAERLAKQYLGPDKGAEDYVRLYDASQHPRTPKHPARDAVARPISGEQVSERHTDVSSFRSPSTISSSSSSPSSPSSPFFSSPSSHSLSPASPSTPSFSSPPFPRIPAQTSPTTRHGYPSLSTLTAFDIEAMLEFLHHFPGPRPAHTEPPDGEWDSVTQPWVLPATTADTHAARRTMNRIAARDPWIKPQSHLEPSAGAYWDAKDAKHEKKYEGPIPADAALGRISKKGDAAIDEDDPLNFDFDFGDGANEGDDKHFNELAMAWSGLEDVGKGFVEENGPVAVDRKARAIWDAILEEGGHRASESGKRGRKAIEIGIAQGKPRARSKGDK